MRFLSVVAVLVLALTVSAWGQQGNGGRVFGSANCSVNMPCPEDTTVVPLSASVLAGMGSACLTAELGYPKGTYFDELAGLDSNHCLTAIPGVLPSGDIKAKLVTSCCVIPHPGTQVCMMHCELHTAN